MEEKGHLNTQEVLEDIYALVRENPPTVIPSFELHIDQSFLTPIIDIETNREMLNQNWCISYYKGIESKRIKHFLKRAIRKVIGFTICPLLEQQNQFNLLTVSIINGLVEQCKTQQERIVELQKQLSELSEGLE